MDDEEWRRDYALTRLFIRKRLGKRPRRVADQEAAIARASDELDGLEGPEAAAARRFLAIEYHACRHATRRRPSLADWEAAIGAVDDAGDGDIRSMARGGMVLRAASGGWDTSDDR